MKIILTGATGLVGSSVLRECISNQDVTHVLALTRKPLPQEFMNNPKVTVVIHDDFLNYSPALLEQLSGAEACLWYEKDFAVKTTSSTNKRIQGSWWSTFPILGPGNLSKSYR